MSRHIVMSQPYVHRGGKVNATPPIVRFSSDGRGLPLIDVKNMVVQVAHGSVPALQGSGVASTSISFRTMWPGYKPDFTARTINLTSINRAQLAAKVAKHIANFYCSAKKGNVASTEPAYGIIEQHLTLHDIFLEGIVNTTGNCWQPIFFLSTSEI